MNAQLTAPAPIEKHAQDMGDKTMAAGTTPFTRAARSADVELMHLLLDKGADPKLVGKDNQTALLVAAGVAWTDHIKGTEAEALEAVKLCVSLGLDVNAATDKGETALHGAAHRGADSIAKYLIDNGANVNARNKRGFTAARSRAWARAAITAAPVRFMTPPPPCIRQAGGENGQEIKETAKAESKSSDSTVVRKRIVQAVDHALRQLVRETLKAVQEAAGTQSSGFARDRDHFQFGIHAVIGLLQAPIEIQTP